MSRSLLRRTALALIVDFMPAAGASPPTGARDSDARAVVAILKPFRLPAVLKALEPVMTLRVNYVEARM